MISNIEISEAISVSKILKTSKALASTRVVKDIIDHINDNNGLAIKFTGSDDSILGIWCSKELETHTSLTFFYMDKSVRMKREVIVFFMHCYEKLDKTKPVLIKTKDTTGFERYVKQIDNDVYQFIGFR